MGFCGRALFVKQSHPLRRTNRAARALCNQFKKPQQHERMPQRPGFDLRQPAHLTPPRKPLRLYGYSLPPSSPDQCEKPWFDLRMPGDPNAALSAWVT
jgi:hypothetical protein